MGNIICIDPGHAGEGNACAAFEDGRLISVWFERVQTQSPTRVGMKHSPIAYEQNTGWSDLIIVEHPEYQGERSDNARPIDLINLSWSGALLAGAFAGRDGCPIIEFTPTEWKGQESKPINHGRLWEVLEVAERNILGGKATAGAIQKAKRKGALKRWKISGADCYPKKFTMHNKLDAVAIGCYFLKRLKKASELKWGA